jgi:hypothetical protein
MQKTEKEIQEEKEKDNARHNELDAKLGSGLENITDDELWEHYLLECKEYRAEPNITKEAYIDLCRGRE